jgi:hypothetical protein
MNEELRLIDPEELSTQLVYELVSQYCSANEMIFSHFRIDGTEVYDELDRYLEGDPRDLEVIDAVIYTKQAYQAELMKVMVEYIESSKEAFERMANDFYTAPTDETWKAFSQFLEGIQWIMQMLNSLNDLGLTGSSVFSEQLSSVLGELETALSNQDYQLSADLLQFEIRKTLEEIAAQIHSYL